MLDVLDPFFEDDWRDRLETEWEAPILVKLALDVLYLLV